jgi:3-dehydroquinate dehydratase type II
VTDLAGFAASAYHRGIDWIAVPTSLLGMIDAAIGGKTGVNHMLGKNLIGSIHPPLAVLAELATLSTLDPREIRSGSAEFVKHGLLHGGALWTSIETNGPDLNSWSTEQLHELIPVCAEVKIKVVEADPCEEDRRMILNLGHTFGHALEAASGYTLTHGEAVFLGLRGMLRISERRGVLDTVEAMTIDKVLRSVKLPDIELDPEQIVSAIRHDKKYRSGLLNWVLLKGVGEPVITHEVAEPDISEVAVWLSEVASYGSRVPAIARHLRFVVLNGPNLNLVGEREPEIYGHRNYLDLENDLAEYSDMERFDLLIRQSNSEAELVSLIQCSRHWADGLVVNAGAYTHTSIAIRDAIAAISIPVVEVHLSDIHAREEFRKDSMLKDVCIGQISGKGIVGYREAIQLLVERIRAGN